MTERFLPPNRNQLARISRDENGRVDERLVRAFEELWKVGGQEVPDIQGQIDALDIRVTANELNIAGNTARIKTNEVLLWLSM